VTRRLAVAASLAAVAAYWILNFLLGPFWAVRRYGREPGVADWAFAMSLGEWLWYAAGLLAALAAALLLRYALRETDARRFTVAWPVAFAVLAAVVIRYAVLQGAPTCDDEMVYLFQARALAGGSWTAAPPPDANAFEHLFLGIYRGHWFGQYSFGHPLVLAPAALLGLAGLVGPLLTGLIVLLVYLLARELFDERVAALSALLAAVSPLLLSTGATLLSQNSATALVLLGILLTLCASKSGRFTHALGATLALGAAFWCRSQEPALLGFFPLLLLAWRVVKGPSRLSLFGGALLGAALTIGPLLLVQVHLWGHPFWTNYQAYWWGYLGVELRSPFGFGPAPWDNFHTPLAGLTALARNLTRLDSFLVGLPLALVVATYGAWTVRSNRRALAVFAGFVLTCVVLFFYFWPGLADTGPQLFHAAGALLLPFVAVGLLTMLRGRFAPVAVAGVITLIATATFWPMHLGALHRAGRAGDEIPRAVADAGVERAVVFSGIRPWTGGHERCWVLGRPLPHTDLRDDVLYLKTQGKPVDLPLARRLFPDREVWLLKQIDGKLGLIRMEDFTGKPSLQNVARERDLP